MHRKKTLKKRFLAMGVTLAMLLTLIPATVSFAETTPQDDAIAKGLDWLNANQNSDGSWGKDDTAFLDTSEAAGYLSNYGVLSDALQKSTAWAEGMELLNNDEAARLMPYVKNVDKLTAIKNTLTGSQNEDGGWGLSKGYDSDVLDTVLALNSLINDDEADTTVLQKAVSYIISRQDSDGSWSFTGKDDPVISLTAQASIALCTYQTKKNLTSSEMQTAMRKAGEYFLSVQKPDKTWGTDEASIACTLLAYRAVLDTVGIDAVDTVDASIREIQNSDGSWCQSPYITALAIKALKERADMPYAKLNSIQLLKSVDGTKTECYSYNAYETFEIQADCTYSNADVKLFYFIKGKDGSLTPITSEQPVWNTVNNLPGDYSVFVQVKDISDGKILASMEKPFSVVPNFRIGNVYVTTNPGFAHVNSSVNVNANVSIENLSNIDKQIDIVTSLYLGDTQVASERKSYNFKASESYAVINGLTFAPDVSSPREYSLKTEVFDGDTRISSAENTFKVIPVSAGDVTFELDMKPDDTASQDIDVAIPKLPPKADVVFAFDLTGSMGGILSTAKSKAITIMNELNKLGIDINYGVVSYMDYPGTYNSYGYYSSYGSYGDYPYKMSRSLTGDIAEVSKSINGLYLGSGNDGPESYTRALYESYADSTIGWRDGTKKIFVNFGDSIPHDNNVNEGVPGTSGVYSTGGDPGRDGKILTADDLDLQTVVAQMAENNVQLIACQTNGAYSNYWSYWANTTGGKCYNTSSSSMVTDVTNAIKTGLTSPEIKDLKLVPSSGFEAWITKITPDSYSGSTDLVVPFTVDLKVPEGTPDGTYIYKLEAIDDGGVKYGTYEFHIRVASGEISPATTISTDKPEYSANEDVGITVSTKNLTNAEESLVGTVDIVDANGVVVKNVADNINETWTSTETKTLNFQWNTGNTFTGDYKARIIWRKAGEVYITAEAPFKIIPDRNLGSSVSTDKAKYTAGEGVRIAETINNNSTNSIETGLTAKLSISGPDGNVIWNTENTVQEIMSQSIFNLKNIWNTEKNAPGQYKVTLEVYKGDAKLSDSSCNFEIEASAEGIMNVTGSLQVLQKDIYPGDPVSFKYTVNNTGNIALTDVTPRIRIVDTAAGTVVGTLTDTADIDVSSSYTAEKTWSHEALKVGNYMVVLDVVLPNGKEVTLGSGYIKVENPYDTTISQVVRPRVLVWAESQGNIVLAQNTLDKMQVFYKMVNNRTDFMTELRTGKYNEYMLLDSKLPLTDDDDKVLAAEVANGKGIIDSRDANGDNLKNLGLFGADFKGSTTPSAFTVAFSADSPFGAVKLTGTGKAQYEALNGGQQLAVLNSRKGASPGVVSNNYGKGKTMLFAFDLGSCTGDTEAVLEKAVRLTAPAEETSDGFAEFEVKVKAYTAVDAELMLNIPEGAEVVWASPVMGSWSFSTAKDQEYTFRVILKLPQEAGVYHVSADTYYAVGGKMIKFDTADMEVTRAQNPLNAETDGGYVQ